MPTAVLKLFAGQGTERTEAETDKGGYMLPPLRSIKTDIIFNCTS